MASTAAMEPHILLPAEILHRGSGVVVWHGGLVQGSTGLALTLVVESDSGEKGNEFLEGEEWEEFGPLGPAGIALRGPDSAGFFVPYADTMRGTGFYRATAFFEREELGDTFLEFFIRPLGQHLVRLPNEAAPAEPLPMLVAPEVLHHEGGYTVWHLGVVQGPRGVISAMEARVDTARGRELMGSGWQLGDRPDGAPLPLGIEIGGNPPQGPLGEPQDEIVGGELSLRRHLYFPGHLTPPTQLIYSAPALNVLAPRPLQTPRRG